ncbi:MAG TPA: hypothetical protein VHT24_06580 [Pseudacidobacterium sp.]|jgi:hypothetical protein|nr:hypothetical protein [Pseudacidobacterium sp.]
MTTDAKHYIAYGGLHDAPEPDFSEVYDTKEAAVQHLTEIFHFEEATRQTLLKRGYAKLIRKHYKMDYCVVKACSCAEPSSHKLEKSSKV